MTFERRTYELPDGNMSALHFGRTSNPLKLVFLHATGFNAQAYKTLLEPLGVHAIALDLRGHGMSELPIDPQGLKDWHSIANDVVAFFERYVDRPVVLAGHSWGAVTSILAAAQLGEKVSGLVAFDPPTVPMIGRIMPYLPGGRSLMKKRFPIARNAGRRRAVFPDLEFAFKRYQGRGTFKGLSDEALRDYLHGGLKPHADGVQLTCDPKWEQAIFLAHGHNTYKAASKAPKHTRILYANEFGPSRESTRRAMMRVVGADKVEFYEDFAHFFPLLNIEFSQQVLNDMIRKVSLSR